MLQTSELTLLVMIALIDAINTHLFDTIKTRREIAMSILGSAKCCENPKGYSEICSFKKII